MPRTATRPAEDREVHDDFMVEENEHPSAILFRQQEAANRISASLMSLRPEAIEDLTPKKRHLMYWKKCDRPTCNSHRSERGWIFHHVGTKGPGGSEQVTEFARGSHSTPLPQFGEWPWNNNAMHGDRDDREQGLNTIEFDYTLPAGNLTNLVGLPGGIEIIPIDQFLLFGLHKIPALAAERMIDIMNHPVYSCDHCPAGMRWFIAEGDLDNHRKVMHAEYMAAMSNARATSKVFAEYVGDTNVKLGQILDRALPANASLESNGVDMTTFFEEFRAMQAELAELKKNKGDS